MPSIRFFAAATSSCCGSCPCRCRRRCPHILCLVDWLLRVPFGHITPQTCTVVSVVRAIARGCALISHQGAALRRGSADRVSGLPDASLSPPRVAIASLFRATAHCRATEFGSVPREDRVNLPSKPSSEFPPKVGVRHTTQSGLPSWPIVINFI